MNFFSYWFSDRIVLAMHRAQPVTREQAPQLFEILERLTARAGIPMPRVYVLPEEPRTPSRPGGTRSTPRWRSRTASCES